MLTNKTGATVTMFAIRHNPTGFYLPDVISRPGAWVRRGSSWVEPVDTTSLDYCIPRLFRSASSAKSALSSWLSGGKSKQGNKLVVKKDPNRIREHMEVVEIQVILPTPGAHTQIYEEEV